MEKLIAQLRILKEMNLKPNYSALAREYGCDRRTVKKYNDGYTGGDKTRNKKSKLDKYSSMPLGTGNIGTIYVFTKDRLLSYNIAKYERSLFYE